ncbi:replication-relaxation family protein [Peribacillus simplex]|uniref:replication-relaxation family protein n=1 Tax=Peribacillus simplex TaxID=1478 RepID=UPI00298D8547|nr:replication-relaxation family protein [Peribacillus simplex]MDW7618032.1 replication-relaxation family protein [Peribacillus simplex]
MRERDKAILDSLKKFRVLNRDQIIAMYFDDTKQAITNCNRVMNRLHLQGAVRVEKGSRPFCYFHGDSNMKFNSMKAPHFKMIADMYIRMCEYCKPEVFEVEPKMAIKGSVEPDAYAVWKGTPFFIEVQRSLYTKKVMQTKVNRYLDYFLSGVWKNPQSLSNTFPVVIILTESDYEIESIEGVMFLQAKDIDDLVKKYMS